MTDEMITKCPKFDFTFRGKCSNSNCMLWHKTETTHGINCLQIDANVVDGLSYTQAKNSRLLMQLAMSEDPKIQLETSQILLQLAMVLLFNISQYETVDYELCECGARKSSCNKNGACRIRRDWFTWLSNLFAPIVQLNPSIKQAHLNHIFITTLLYFYRNLQLPPFIAANLPNLALSKRIV